MEALELTRRATRGAHGRLDRRLRFEGAAVTLERYVAYLQRMAPVVAEADARMNGRPDLLRCLPDAAARAKVPWLLQDLDDLSARPHAGPVGLPAARDLPSLFGTLYVIEGSTLGGAVLARRVEAALGPVPTRYLRAYGERPGEMWRSFCAGMEAAARDEASRRRVAIAAVETFETIERWLAGGGLLEEELNRGSDPS